MKLENNYIVKYTRADAIKDGVLIDLWENYKDVCTNYYKHPIACTSALWSIITTAAENKKSFSDYRGIISDILHMSRVYKRVLTSSDVLTLVKITGAGRKKNYFIKLSVHPGDNLEPVITLMLDGED